MTHQAEPENAESGAAKEVLLSITDGDAAIAFVEGVADRWMAKFDIVHTVKRLASVSRLPQDMPENIREKLIARQESMIDALTRQAFLEGWIAGDENGRAVARIKDVAPAPAAPAAQYLIWSNERRLWWRPNRCGYTIRIEEAGRYSREDALRICKNARDGWRPGDPPPEIPVLDLDASHCGASA